jgi:phytoene dehydrogenase-like protein
MAEYNLFKKIKDAGLLGELVLEIENQIIKILTDSIYPMLKEKIIAKFSFSPLSIESRVGSSEGSIVGWAFEKEIPAINNILKVNSSILTPIDNISQIGQWVYSPAGVPMSVLTGKIAANKIIKGKFK